MKHAPAPVRYDVSNDDLRALAKHWQRMSAAKEAGKLTATNKGDRDIIAYEAVLLDRCAAELESRVSSGIRRRAAETRRKGKR